MATTFDRLSALADCLCAELEKAGTPNLCFCGVLPGEVASADYMGGCGDKNGMAWVRLKNMYPSTSVGTANVTVGNCDKEIGFDVEMGVMRVYSVGDSRGNPPTAKQSLDAAAMQIMDAETMLKAINCCDAISSRDYIVGLYEPAGPEGGIVGGMWTISMI